MESGGNGVPPPIASHEELPHRNPPAGPHGRQRGNIATARHRGPWTPPSLPEASPRTHTLLVGHASLARLSGVESPVASQVQIAELREAPFEG